LRPRAVGDEQPLRAGKRLDELDALRHPEHKRGRRKDAAWPTQ
jgi:hypothetical protein